MHYNQRATGGLYETMAAEYLQRQGLKILEKNFRCRTGEIDLIAKDGRYYVFVEVKYRRGRGSGWSLEAVNPKKQKTIGKVALYYLLVHCHRTDVPCRFDVVGIDGETITWIPNAYDVG